MDFLEILENRTMFGDTFVENGTQVYGFLVKKRPIRAAHPLMF